MHSNVSSSGSGEEDDMTMESPTTPSTSVTPVSSSGRKVGGKPNVSAACAPCKKAHLACDVARPCKRCVNMGKEEACTDVPHKKRGRPKTIRPQIDSSGPLERSVHTLHRPEPPTYQTMRPWRGSHSKVMVPPHDRPMYPGRHSSHPYSRPSSPQYETRTASCDPPPASIFTLFASTSLQIVRASAACQALTGYLPHEYINLPLLHYIHPEDVPIIESDRLSLVQDSRLPMPLHSQRETLAAMAAAQSPTMGQRPRSERELLSPAEGMHQPYPNRNVRVLRADNEYDLYNVRLHIGGGLGANLHRPETYGRSYIVVSMLRLPPEVAIKFHRAAQRAQPHNLRLPGSRSTSVSGHPPPSRGNSISPGMLSPLCFDERESLTISPIDQRSPTSPDSTSLPSLKSITSTIPPPMFSLPMARSFSGPSRPRPEYEGPVEPSLTRLPPLANPVYSPGSEARPTSSSSLSHSRHSDSRLIPEHHDERDRDRDRAFTPRSAPLPAIDHTDHDVETSPVNERNEQLVPLDPKRDVRRIWE